MNVKDIPIKELIPADYNPRYISDDAFEQLKKSLKDFDAVEPIVINTHKGRENIIIGGHMRIRAAKALGWDTFPCVEVDLPLERERELNVKLNKTTGEFDEEKLANFFDADELTEWGFSAEEIFKEPEEDEYTTKVESPVYEPSEVKPEINELYNVHKYTELMDEIDETEIDEEIKELLKVTATRHIVFDYSKIADYYAHADEETRNLMENSALVIIDYNKAIEKGFVELYGSIDKINEQDG
jgi:hypothetical protein